MTDLQKWLMAQTGTVMLPETTNAQELSRRLSLENWARSRAQQVMLSLVGLPVKLGGPPLQMDEGLLTLRTVTAAGRVYRVWLTVSWANERNGTVCASEGYLINREEIAFWPSSYTAQDIDQFDRDVTDGLQRAIARAWNIPI